MAYSDWDLAAWGPDAKPCAGGMQVGNATSLCLEKNRVVVKDENLWEPGGEWSKPTVLVVYRDDEHGVVREAAGIRLVTAAGPQGAIFVLAATGHGDDVRLFGGLGCRGYDWAFDLIGAMCAKYGLSPGDRDNWGWSSGYDRRTGGQSATLDGPHGRLEWWRGGCDEREPDTHVYVGARPETVEAFFAWGDEVVMEDGALGVAPGVLSAWLGRARAEGCLRLCQGDAFLAPAIDGPLVDVPCTPPGQAFNPIALTLITGGREREILTRLPYHSYAEWLEIRMRHAEKHGRLAHGLSRRGCPGVARRLPSAERRSGRR